MWGVGCRVQGGSLWSLCMSVCLYVSRSLGLHGWLSLSHFPSPSLSSSVKASFATGAAAWSRGAILWESFNLKLSGNEVYCTNALQLLIKIMLYSKLHCQIFCIENIFYKIVRSSLHGDGDRIHQSGLRRKAFWAHLGFLGAENPKVHYFIRRVLTPRGLWRKGSARALETQI